MEQNEFIQNLRKQWLIVKAGAAMDCEAKNLPNLAKAYRECAMFRGDETVQQLANLIKSTKGSEFCLRYNFPNIASLRFFKPQDPAKYGVYIDGGAIHLKNPEQGTILLAGRIAATIDIDDNKKRYEVIMIHGAKAVINARYWSVVCIKQGQGCIAIRNATENAVIL